MERERYNTFGTVKMGISVLDGGHGVIHRLLVELGRTFALEVGGA